MPILPLPGRTCYEKKRIGNNPTPDTLRPSRHLSEVRLVSSVYERPTSMRSAAPTLSNIDKSGANQASITDFNMAQPAGATPLEGRQCKYLNNIVEQDHRVTKRKTRPMLELKSFNTTRVVLGGIELVHMIRKSQRSPSGFGAAGTAAEQFYRVAA